MPFEVLQEQLDARRALPPPPVRRALRKGAGISLETLAAAVGVSRETLRLWELGLHRPYEKNLAAYVEALEIIRDGGR